MLKTEKKLKFKEKTKTIQTKIKKKSTEEKINS